MNRRRIALAESNESEIVSWNDRSDADSQSEKELSLNDQQRLVDILDQYMIDVEEGRAVETSKLLIDNADIASSIQHYLGGIQIAKDVRENSTSKHFGRLGDYLLGPIIGQGAMGIVYKARDTVRQREVAVKVLAHATALDQTHIDRFRLEAKAAASLDHPNVVPVYSVGFDKSTHYYAMQLIEGRSLDRRITAAQRPSSSKNTKLGTAPVSQAAAPLVGPDRYRRISQIGVSAANALHSAHSAGIIHRDVKPSNLMLGNDGQLWVTDFGLARVQSEVGLTRTGEIVGTLRYMSPEQAGGDGDLIDARTDVYGLGATLYELVTGVPAFAADDAVTLLNDIRYKEPAAIRQVDPAVPRDLETIILRAMRPRSADRYPTAAALATDLQRFVEGRRINASSISIAERVFAWARHHKHLARSVLAIWFCLLIASFATTYFVSTEQRKTTVALRASEQHYRQARRAVDTLGAQIARRLSKIPGAGDVRQDVLAETIQYYEQFIESSINDPKLVHDVARTRLEIARLTAMLGTYADANHAYNLASNAFVSILKQRHPGDPERTSQAVLHYVRALNEWSLVTSNHGDQPSALNRLSAALMELARTEFTSPETRLHALLVEALTRNNRGVVFLRTEAHLESMDEFERAIAILQSVPENHADNVVVNAELNSELADTFSNISALLSESGQYARAAAAAQQSTRLRSMVDKEYSAKELVRLAISHNNLAALQWRAGGVNEAIAAYREAIALLETSIQQTPTNTVPRDRLAVTLNNLGMALADAGDAEEAETVLMRSASLAKPARDADPSDSEAAKRLAGIQNNLGVLMRDQGRTQEAEDQFRSALQMIKSARSESTPIDTKPIALELIQSNLEKLSLPERECR